MSVTAGIEERLSAVLRHVRDDEQDEAIAQLRGAADATLAIESAGQRAAVLTDLARFAMVMAMPAALEELLAASENAWTQAQGADCLGAWECRLARAVLSRVAGDWSASRDMLGGALHAQVTPDSADVLLRALHMLAMAEVELGSADAAERALVLAEDIMGHHEVEPYSRMEVGRSRGMLALARGRFDDALEAFDGARSAAMALEPPQPEAVARCLRSTVGALMGAQRLEEAHRTVDRSISMLEALPEPPGILAELLADSAGLAYAGGDLATSSAHAARALEVAERVWSADDPRLIHLLCMVAAFHIEHGSGADPTVEDLLHRGIGLAATVAPEGQAAAEARALLGRYYVTVGRHDEAVASLSRALSLYQGMQASPAVIADTMRALALAFYAQGETATAIEGLEAAQAHATEGSPLSLQILSDLNRVRGAD